MASSRVWKPGSVGAWVAFTLTNACHSSMSTRPTEAPLAPTVQDWAEDTMERLTVVQGKIQQLDDRLEQLEQQITTIRDQRQEYVNAERT